MQKIIVYENGASKSYHFDEFYSFCAISPQIKFIVRQIQFWKKVNLNMEYWLGNTEKLKSLRVKVLPSLLSSHLENRIKSAQ